VRSITILKTTVSDSLPQDYLPQSLHPLGTIPLRDEARQPQREPTSPAWTENLAAGEPALLPGVSLPHPIFFFFHAPAIANLLESDASLVLYRMSETLRSSPRRTKLGGIDERATDTLPPWKIAQQANAHALRRNNSSPRVPTSPRRDRANGPGRSRPTSRNTRRQRSTAHDIVLLLTAGYSMGRPRRRASVVNAARCENRIFHKLPTRPGKPILGAGLSTHPGSLRKNPFFGLPVNHRPDATMGACDFAMPLVDKLADLELANGPTRSSRSRTPVGKHLPYCMGNAKPVRLTAVGRAETTVIGKGFRRPRLARPLRTDSIEMPPHANAPGPNAVLRDGKSLDLKDESPPGGRVSPTTRTIRVSECGGGLVLHSSC